MLHVCDKKYTNVRASYPGFSYHCILFSDDILGLNYRYFINTEREGIALSEDKCTLLFRGSLKYSLIEMLLCRP